MSIPAGTKFIGIASDVDTYERKSAQANSPSNVYTIEEIKDGVVPDSRLITINGNTQDLTANRNYTVTDANLSTSDITTNDVSITKHGFAPKAPNDITKFLRGDGTWASAGSSGVWGISNASGVYTYYATLQLAINAATSGQVIEMFADVTETTLITLKDGVVIQGNGHTYTYSGNTGHVFQATTSGTYLYMNMNIKRANTATSTGAIFYGGSGYNSYPVFKFSSVNVTYTTTSGTAPISATDGSSRITFDGINVIGNSSGYLFDSSYIIIAIKNSIIENIGTGGCITTANYGARISFENLYLKTVSGTGIFMNYANDVIINSTGVSSTGAVFAGQSGATAYDCFAFSNTSSAFSGLVCYNCTGHTITGSAFSSGSSLYNCAGRSSSTGYAVGIGFGGTRAFNSSFYSIQSIPVYGVDYGAYIYNCSVICDYNNAAGHGVSCGPSSGNPAFVNNYIQVFNTSANCIRGTNPFTGVVTNCVFKGATTPINANVTLSAVTINTTYNNITI